jgi:hypothetical protein
VRHLSPGGRAFAGAAAAAAHLLQVALVAEHHHHVHLPCKVCVCGRVCKEHHHHVHPPRPALPTTYTSSFSCVGDRILCVGHSTHSPAESPARLGPAASSGPPAASSGSARQPHPRHLPVPSPQPPSLALPCLHATLCEPTSPGAHFLPPHARLPPPPQPSPPPTKAHLLQLDVCRVVVLAEEHLPPPHTHTTTTTTRPPPPKRASRERGGGGGAAARRGRISIDRGGERGSPAPRSSLSLSLLAPPSSRPHGAPRVHMWTVPLRAAARMGLAGRRPRPGPWPQEAGRWLA